MNTELAIFLVFLAGILGGAISGLIGWTNTQETFNGKSFLNTVLRSAVGSALATAKYVYSPDTPFMDALLLALAGGATADVLGHRIAGSIAAKRMLPKPPSP